MRAAYADDGEGVALQGEGFAEGGGVGAEAALPEPVTQHGRGGPGSSSASSRSERPAVERAHAQLLEELRGGHAHADLFGGGGRIHGHHISYSPNTPANVVERSVMAR